MCLACSHANIAFAARGMTAVGWFPVSWAPLLEQAPGGGRLYHGMPHYGLCTVCTECCLDGGRKLRNDVVIHLVVFRPLGFGRIHWCITGGAGCRARESERYTTNWEITQSRQDVHQCVDQYLGVNNSVSDTEKGVNGRRYSR